MRLQIASTLALLAAIAAVIAAVVSYTSVQQRLNDETDGFLSNRMAQVLAFNDAFGGVEGGPGLAGFPFGENRAGADTADIAPFVRFDAEIAFLALDGSTILAISETRLPTKPSELERALQPDTVVASRVDVEDRVYETRLAAAEGPDQEPVIIQIGRDVTEQQQTLDQLRSRLMLLVAVVALAAAAIGSFLASRLVRPLENLRAATREIAERKDFSKPIEVAGTGEISDVTSDFNLMLQELDESLKQQHHLVQDAGHELRTPLSTLRASVELMQRMGSGHESDRDELLATANTELVELTRLVNELVELAASPFDETPIELIDLGDVVAAAVRAFSVKNSMRDITVERGDNQPISGRRAHLERAVANMLANADKFAGPGTSVEVSVQNNRIQMRDHGPGIPEDDLGRVFDKFFRSPTVQSITGSGLGLAFVAEIVKSHEGTATASNHPDGGAVITLHFPAVVQLARQ